MFACRNVCGWEKLGLLGKGYREADGKCSCVPLARVSSRSDGCTVVREREREKISKGLNPRGTSLHDKALKLRLWVTGSQLLSTH